MASLIIEKMNDLKRRGIIVNSHEYINYFWNTLGGPFEKRDIYYFRHEEFLQGLINLERNLKDGKEHRVQIKITDNTSPNDDEMYFNSPGSQDEQELERQIEMQIKKQT